MTILDDARPGMDLDIRPQDDLFGHVNGRWLDEIEIPSDRAVPLAVNRGNPVVLAEESADVSKAIKQMAKELFPTAKEEGKKRRFMRPATARA